MSSLGNLATQSNGTSTAPTADFSGFEKYEGVGKFDRRAKKAPYYLEGQLRTRGWWRMWDYLDHDLGHDSVYYRSQAFGEAMFAPKGVFLDAGCGWSADALIASHAGYTKCYKVDLFPLKGRNEFGEPKIAKAEKGRVKFIRGDICEPLPIPDNSVDLISCNAMIDLIEPEARILFYKQTWRLLKAGGQLSIQITKLKNGYGTDLATERATCLALGFTLERQYTSIFIVEKPKSLYMEEK